MGSLDYVFDPNKSTEENETARQLFEGEKKLLQAKQQLQDAKAKEKREMEAKEKEAVSGYLSRFTKKVQRRKERNPKLNDSSGLKPGTTPAAKPGSGTLNNPPAPPKMKDLIASEYLESYGSLTPKNARKKKMLMSDAEKNVNEEKQT